MQFVLFAGAGFLVSLLFYALQGIPYVGSLLLVGGGITGACYLFRASETPLRQRLLIVAGVLGGGTVLWQKAGALWGPLSKMLGA